jgi:small-conductance mechanosensitive channel
MTGWIKLHRKFLDWEWYQDIPVKNLFIHILLTANYEDRKWRGMDIHSGELITSVQHLSEGSGLSVQQVRTALKKLESTGEITVKSTNKFTLVTVLKYSDYQTIEECEQQTSNKQATNKQQTSNKQITTTKEGKKERRKEVKKEKDSIGEIANPLFPAFISAYDGFIKHLTNVPAKINGKEGKAAKEIINYMTRACRNKNATATDEDVLNAFRYVLDNYAKWEKFHQGQLELSQISKNLVNIINAIKNGRVDKAGKAPATDPADIRRIVEAGILSVTVP